MPFERPTLEDLVDRVRADVEYKLEGADAHLRRTYEDVLSVANAGLTHGLHGHLVWLSQQLIPDSSEDEFAVRWADIFGVARLAAQQAAGFLVITGVNATVHPDASLWQRGDGVLFQTVGDTTITGSEGVAAVIAVDAGAAGNSTAGQSFSIVSPQSGVDSIAVVDDGGIVDGSDIEEIPALLERLLLRLRQPPKGGGPGDYERWAREVAGVTRAFELPSYLGVGTVGVTFLVDGEVSPIPIAGKVDEVQDYIDTKAPITAAVTVFAPTGVTQNIVIDDLSPDTAAVRAAISAELTDLWLRKAEPGGTIFLSQINEAISIATGEEDHTLTTPVADVTVTAGQISLLGTISYT